MKQIIERNSDGSVSYKYYLNHLGKTNGIEISYLNNGKIYCKKNYINGKRFGLDNWYSVNNKPIDIMYNL